MCGIGALLSPAGTRRNGLDTAWAGVIQQLDVRLSRCTDNAALDAWVQAIGDSLSPRGPDHSGRVAVKLGSNVTAHLLASVLHLRGHVMRWVQSFIIVWMYCMSLSSRIEDIRVE